MVTTGFHLITLDIPTTHETYSFQKTIQLTTLNYQPAKQKMDLGYFPAWSSFKVSFESNVRIGLKIGATNTNIYPTTTNSALANHTIKYTSFADKHISIYVVFEPFQSNSGVQSSAHTVLVVLNITISKSINNPTNTIFIALLTFLSLLFIRRRNMNNWLDDEAKHIPSIQQLDAKRTYRMKNTWCDNCGRNYYGLSDSRMSTRNCTFTCNLISLKPLIIGFTVFILIVSWFRHWMLIPGTIFFMIAIYTIESDTHIYRYKMYPKRKKQLEEETKERVKVINAIPTKYIEGLDEEFLVCCYQTARLGELYCECGRIVPSELRQFLDLENLT